MFQSDATADSSTKTTRRSFLLAPRIKATASQKVPPDVSQQKRKQSSDVVESTSEARLLLGDIVSISGVKSGILRYLGTTKFAAGDWCGIELSCQDGKHDGTVKGVCYFTCPPNRGIFAPCHKVALVSRTDSADIRTSKDALPPSGSKVSRLAKGKKSTSKLAQPVPLPKSKKASFGSGTRDGGHLGGKVVGKRPGKAGKAVKQAANANTTFDLQSNLPPIDPHKALTFAYGIEPTSPESDLTTQQLNDTFKVAPNVTRRLGLPRSHSSISDLFSPIYHRGANLPRSLSQFAVFNSLPDGSPWRDGFDDPLTPAQFSNASSLGLLTDTQLDTVSFSLDLAGAGDVRRPSPSQLDYVLDWDMSDIGSPRQPYKDSRSSTPVAAETVTSAVPLRSGVGGGHTSTPTSPVKVKVTEDVVITDERDLVTTDDIGHDVIRTDDIGHDVVRTDDVDQDFAPTDDVRHSVVTADDSDHDIDRLCTDDHDVVTTVDDTHDLVTTTASAQVMDESGHNLLTTGDGDYDLVTFSDSGSDLVMVDKDDHDFVTTVDDTHDLTMTVDDVVTNIDDVVTTVGDGHDLVTTGDCDHDSDNEMEPTSELKQEYSMTCAQEPSTTLVTQTTPPVSDTPHNVTTSTGQVAAKDPECPSLTFDIPVDDNTAKTSHYDGEHSSQSEASKMSGDTHTDDQLLADLSEGHHKRERPVSVLSTCSTDTGVELDTVSDRQRPISIISVSSIDTGESGQRSVVDGQVSSQSGLYITRDIAVEINRWCHLVKEHIKAD